MNHAKSNSEKFSKLRDSKRFWGWTIFGSAMTAIICPLLSLFAVVYSVTGSFTKLHQGQSGEMDYGIVFEGISGSLAVTVLGGIVTILALIVFVVALIFYLVRGKSMQALAEKVIFALKDDLGYSEVFRSS